MVLYKIYDDGSSWKHSDDQMIRRSSRFDLVVIHLLEDLCRVTLTYCNQVTTNQNHITESVSLHERATVRVVLAELQSLTRACLPQDVYSRKEDRKSMPHH